MSTRQNLIVFRGVLVLALLASASITGSVMADTQEVQPVGDITDIRYFDGKVGIGTMYPGTKFTIVDGNASFSFDGSAVGSGYDSHFTLDNTGLKIGQNTTIRDFRLRTGNMDRLTITGGGNVGIGTTNPGATLEVNGDFITRGPWIDARVYSDFATAVSSIGSITEVTLLVPSDMTISSAVVVTSNIHLMLIGNGKFTYGIGGSLNIKGPFDAPLKQVFVGFSPGGVRFAQTPGYNAFVYPQWWGAKGDNSYLNGQANAFNCAIQSVKDPTHGSGGTVYVPSGVYLLDDTILISGNGIKLIGSGKSTCLFLTGGAYDRPVIKLDWANSCVIKDFTIQSDVSSPPDIDCHGIYLKTSGKNHISNIWCAGVPQDVISLEDALYNYFENILADTSVVLSGVSYGNRPLYGIHLKMGAVGYKANCNVFVNCRMQGVKNAGIWLDQNAVSNTFVGCVTEGADRWFPSDTPVWTERGVLIDGAGALNNTFIGHYFEGGTYSIAPRTDTGNRNLWITTNGLSNSEDGVIVGNYSSGGFKIIPQAASFFFSFNNGSDTLSFGEVANNAFGLDTGDYFDLHTNKNVLKPSLRGYSVANGGVPSGGGTIDLRCSGYTDANIYGATVHFVEIPSSSSSYTIAISDSAGAIGEGQEIILEINRKSGHSGSLSFSTAAGDFVTNATVPTAGKRKNYSFYYNAELGKFVLLGTPSANF